MSDEDAVDRSEGERAAGVAVYAYLAEHPDTPLNEVFAHFFPPSPHPFTREEMRRAVVEGLYYGRLTWDDERRLNVADPEPQPGDGPEYHEDHAAWERRQTAPESVRYTPSLDWGALPPLQPLDIEGPSQSGSNTT